MLFIKIPHLITTIVRFIAHLSATQQTNARLFGHPRAKLALLVQIVAEQVRIQIGQLKKLGRMVTTKRQAQQAAHLFHMGLVGFGQVIEPVGDDFAADLARICVIQAQITGEIVVRV